MTERLIADLDPDQVADLHRQRDDLVARIEEEELLPGWCWPIMMDTLTELVDLPDDLAWLPVRYLQAVTIRRVAMFPSVAAAQQQLGIPDPPVYRLQCSCGGWSGQAPQQKRGGRWVRIGRCEGCGGDLVEFDDDPYTKPTLIAQGLGRDLYGTPNPPTPV